MMKLLLIVAISLSASTLVLAATESLPAPTGWPQPSPAPATPGPAYAPPVSASVEIAPGAPRVYQTTAHAGPDETFFLVGSGLTSELAVWGAASADPAGQAWTPRVQFAKDGYVAATLPDRAQDGLFLVWAHNKVGWSRPFRLNAPELWWCGPDIAAPGDTVRIFGRDLARRPDRTTAFVYLDQPGQAGQWLEAEKAGKYAVTVRIPQTVNPGSYELWVHAGFGGAYGWGGPVKLTIVSPQPEAAPTDAVAAPAAGATVDIQALVDAAAQHGGVVRLGAGVFLYRGTLRIPAGVTLAGAGAAKTRLQFVLDPSANVQLPGMSGWNRAPGRIHTPGDTMEYRVRFPQAGEWTVWLRYATEMSPWKQTGVSGNMTLQVDDGTPVPLENLPNTGSFGTFKWSRSASVQIGSGEHILRWKNVKGGGISLDAFVFARDPKYQPSDTPFPETGPGVVVVQGEDVTKFVSKEGELPGEDAAAVWLTGDRAGLRDLTISANSEVNLGVAIRSPRPLQWIDGCRIEGVRIADVDGKQGENCGIRLFDASHAVVSDSEIWGRAPLFLSGVRQCRFAGNRLVSVTRWGGNAEAAILGRTDIVEECIIENNRIGCPPGAEAGGPTARRLIWISTGHGSVTHNWIAGNGVNPPSGPGASVGAGQARFGGVAGTEQNVGEMILFEGNHRTMFFGSPAAADSTSVTLPKVVPTTPDARLGSVKRDQLAHDAQGNETPFWPPNVDDGSPEPPINQYYVSVFKGPGQGETRRVVDRRGTRLILDRPWREAPTSASVIAVGVAFYQNLIVDNYTPDGMTGIQLWISCIENVIADNTIARQRKPGIFLYANGTTLASSMPRTWNRGISPLFFNTVEGTRCDECSAGALVTSGDAAGIPIEFPRALGNVLRHNSFIRSRGDGVVITGRKGEAEHGDVSPSILGTIAEFNVVRDAVVGYHAGPGSDGVVFRRNHAYFWYPVNNSTDPPVAFEVDTPGATVAISENSVEGKTGTGDKRIVNEKRGGE